MALPAKYDIAIYQGDDFALDVKISSPVAPTTQAQWSPTTEYGTGAQVQYNGQVWDALQASMGQVPSSASTYWQLVTAPTNLTGWTGRAQVRTDFDAVDTLAICQVEFADRLAGHIRIKLASTVTNGLAAPQSGVWDAELTDATGLVRTWLRGRARVHPQVTR